MIFAPCFKLKTVPIQWTVILVAIVVVTKVVEVQCDNTTLTPSNDVGPDRRPNSKELVLTAKEKAALDKFKSRVFDRVPRELELLRQDLYFLRFLRAHNLDVDRAAKDLIELVKFFKDHHLRTILKEDWTDMEEDFPVYFTEDREKRPVLYVTLQGVWNLRQGLLQGHHRMIRYIYKLAMETYYRLEGAGRKHPNVTQISVIMDLDGFNLLQQGCPACISVMFYLFEIYERWIPAYTHEIILVNAPSSVYVLLQTLRPVLSEHTNSVLRIFTTNKNRWKPFLDERIDPKQLPDFLGGTKTLSL